MAAACVYAQQDSVKADTVKVIAKDSAIARNAGQDSAVKASKLDVPVRILLTKADRIIESKINANKEAVSIQLTDYESHILPAIEEVENLSKRYYELFPEQKVDWLSLRYHEEKIDPIQLSLKKLGSEQIQRFTPVSQRPNR